MTVNVFDGLALPTKPFDDARIVFSSRGGGGGGNQQIINAKLKELQNYIKVDHTNYIKDYHHTFDVLFRASERVRHHQKFQFREQKKLAQEAFEKELEEIEDCRHEEVPVKNTMEFVPKDMEISDLIAPYMQLAIETGKTLMEVFRDEGAPELTDTVCEAITHLQYYSGEFDIEWGNDVTFKGSPWHQSQVISFNNWLVENNHNPFDLELSLGYLKLGDVDLINSFGTKNAQDIWQQMGDFLDIYRIECGNTSVTYDYHWSDTDYERRQIENLS